MKGFEVTHVNEFPEDSARDMILSHSKLADGEYISLYSSDNTFANITVKNDGGNTITELTSLDKEYIKATVFNYILWNELGPELQENNKTT